MENKNHFSEFFNEEIKVMAYCPFCEADLNPVEAKIIDDSGDSQFVHIQCKKCKGYILALITTSLEGISSIGLITDLNFNDVYRFKSMNKVTSEDVLGIYKNFEKKNIIKDLINNY